MVWRPETRSRFGSLAATGKFQLALSQEPRSPCNELLSAQPPHRGEVVTTAANLSGRSRSAVPVGGRRAAAPGLPEVGLLSPRGPCARLRSRRLRFVQCDLANETGEKRHEARSWGCGRCQVAGRRLRGRLGEESQSRNRPSAVSRCRLIWCPMWPYRMRSNPFRRIGLSDQEPAARQARSRAARQG